MSASTGRRRDFILRRILDEGRVEVKKLAQDMAVSDATVRRDLRSLADLSQVELVYGGATLPRATDFSFRSKAMRNVEAKRVIGGLAAGLVSDNEQIFIDSGTTCFEMCHHLKRRRGLRAIVNSTRLAFELGNSAEISVILIGGLTARSAWTRSGRWRRRPSSSCAGMSHLSAPTGSAGISA